MLFKRKLEREIILPDIIEDIILTGFGNLKHLIFLKTWNQCFLQATYMKYKTFGYVGKVYEVGLVCFVRFYGISTFAGYLIPNPFLHK